MFIHRRMSFILWNITWEITTEKREAKGDKGGEKNSYFYILLIILK